MKVLRDCLGGLVVVTQTNFVTFTVSGGGGDGRGNAGGGGGGGNLSFSSVADWRWAEGQAEIIKGILEEEEEGWWKWRWLFLTNNDVSQSFQEFVHKYTLIFSVIRNFRLAFLCVSTTHL